MNEQEDPRRRFAEECRSGRELYPERQLNQDQLARMLRTSRSTVSRVETCRGPIPPDLPPLLDQVFSTDGLFKRLYEEIVSRSHPALYRRRMALEREAIAVREWSPTVVPGLLQTPDYARLLFRAGNPRASEGEISASVAARMARQGILKADVPPDVHVVLCESVIRRLVGGREVMGEQLAALLKHGAKATTRIQVLPLDAEAHLFIDGAVTLLTDPHNVTRVCADAFRTTAIVEDPEQVRRAVRTYDGLMGEALMARESAYLIKDQMEKLT
ncbi:Scr1 family TA system antitoxin-like transcriptional regulator [Streptomyces sp. NPDC001339]|uniref:helix-turn-helix domain-containing protein n=1 Tax=Streptomyces sp. NPDC001339 TaxID=3364563 RepID=UPI0036B25AD8